MRSSGLAILGVATLFALFACAVPTPQSPDRDACGVPGSGVLRLAGLKTGEYLDREERDLQAALASRDSAILQREINSLVVVFKLDVLFDPEADMLKEGAEEELRRVAKVLNCYTDSRLLVSSHTDSIGSEQQNLDLSQRRALTVKDLLTRSGVAPDRITAQGHGENQPIASNATEAGRQLNRRVTIEIIPGHV